MNDDCHELVKLNFMLLMVRCIFLIDSGWCFFSLIFYPVQIVVCMWSEYMCVHQAKFHTKENIFRLSVYSVAKYGTIILYGHCSNGNKYPQSSKYVAVLEGSAFTPTTDKKQKKKNLLCALVCAYKMNALAENDLCGINKLLFFIGHKLGEKMLMNDRKKVGLLAFFCLIILFALPFYFRSFIPSNNCFYVCVTVFGIISPSPGKESLT